MLNMKCKYCEKPLEFGHLNNEELLNFLNSVSSEVKRRNKELFSRLENSEPIQKPDTSGFVQWVNDSLNK